MVFIKVKVGDRVQVAGIKPEEFTVRSYIFWRINNYAHQELILDGFGMILSKYVTEIL